MELREFEKEAKTYTGNKVVRAAPCTRQEYNDYRGWELPEGENGEDPGYLVEYETDEVIADPNVQGHTGYVTWLTQGMFDAIFSGETEKEIFDFSTALKHLKNGKRVARSGWNGKNMFLFLVAGSRFQVNRPPLLGIYEEGTEIEYHAHIDMKTAQGYVVPWLASQSDMLADDWNIVEDKI